MVRFKNRYALCELVFPDGRDSVPPIDNHQVYQAVKASLLETHGDYGLGALQSSLNVKYLNIKTNIAIIRGERRHFDMLASSLVFIKKVGKTDVIFRTLHVGGSIRSCQKFIIKHHRKNMAQLFPQCKTPEQQAEVMESIMAACESLEFSYKYLSSQRTGTSTHSALKMLQAGEGEEEDTAAS